MPESDATTFAALGVAAPLVEILTGQGITVPFPVQAATLPDGLAGRDILGRAQTGSGKTLGFSLPLVTRLAGGTTASRRPRGLILVPTRELAAQVTLVLKPLARAMGLLVTTIYGGVAYGPQVSALQHKTDIIVATPGRLADLIGQRECDLSDVEVTVIDEADQMADLGFLPIVRRLLEITPEDGQRMLFSATLDSDVDVLARRFLHAPALHSVDENSSPAEIEHHVFTVEAANRIAVLAALAGGEKRSLVFVRTRHGAERTARQLTEAGIPAAELHGNLRQGARSRNLDAFASGLARVMVATDIAARGIHIDSIDLVIHADPPAEHKAYVHRSGRTARGGAAGVVVTLQTRAQVRDVTLMMGKAYVTPHPAVAVDAGSAVLAEIAGPPAPRITVAGKVSQLVQPEDRLARADRPRVGRPGVGRPGPGRPRRDGQHDRKPRDDRSAGRGPRGAGPRERDRGDDRGNDGSGYGREEGRARFQGGYRQEQPQDGGRHYGVRADDRSASDRGARGQGSDGRGSGGRGSGEGRERRDGRGGNDRGGNERGGYDWWPRTKGHTAPGRYQPGRPYREGQSSRDDRPARDERPYRGERAARPQAGEHPQPAGRPQPAGQSSGPRTGQGGRPQGGGHFGGSSRRPGYSAGPGTAGKRRG